MVSVKRQEHKPPADDFLRKIFLSVQKYHKTIKKNTKTKESQNIIFWDTTHSGEAVNIGMKTYASTLCVT